MSAHDARLIGDVYRIGQVLKTIGTITNYTAYNRNTNDVVGLIVIELPPTISTFAVQPFFQSLEQRRSLESPHVLRIHQGGIDGNRIYIATDPPRGTTLQHVIDTEDITVTRAIQLVQQVARGLQVFHARGLTGLDLRPHNLTIDTIGITDRMQIDDIGLRPLLLYLSSASGQEPPASIAIDLRYTSPEYMKDGIPRASSDIYQLGLLLFYLVTGRLPFVGRTAAETGILQSASPIPVMNQYTYNTPPRLQEIVERLLSKDPAQRYNDLKLLNTDLEMVAQALHQPSQALPQSKEPTRPTQPGANLTTEISVAELDIALQQTIPPGSITTLTGALSSIIPTPDGIYAYLSFESENAPPQKFAITQKSTIIGRLDPKRGVSPDLDLSTLDPTMTISRQHARIRFEETFFYIEDLKSRNKTRLGQLVLPPLKAELLHHGDLLSFGSVRLRFEIPGH
ncbi:FHA domain-containing serine/threonine-protein kinase [Tengunoibacter tsumagoiensis]|uniref:non-specific serine/threonine protein kinase n=1 Tax=Tengunoibacter tsumagoiensis TaxID=2014871 RepID=A0A402A0L1_9CHLR|nr:protein kinase [Tengunoibacter tsumagoiensis]GCE12599.1 hypothetical protein KTT_24580 [Tengunoibacter tsumagoiensis]